MMKALSLDGSKVLVLLPGVDRNVVLSARNIPGVTTFPADKISAYDVLSHGKVLIFKSALSTLEQSFGSSEGAAS
jgi:large subunit ribosomal protein L4